MSILSLNKASDLFEKCRYEINLLKMCESHPNYEFHIFNIVMGLNHLFEWFIKDKDINIEKRKACIRKFNPYDAPDKMPNDKAIKNIYKTLADFPDTNQFQLNIRKLCNKAKHCNTKAFEKNNKTYNAVCGSIECGSSIAVCGGYYYRYTVEINGSDQDIEEMLIYQTHEWSSYF